MANLKYRRVKKWYKSKTLWLNVAAGFFGVLQIPAVIAGTWPEWFVLLFSCVVSAINIGLRFVTTQPIFVRTTLRNDRKLLDLED